MGNKWVFLRGLTRGTIHWGDFPEVFSNLAPQYESQYLEIPGNGTRVHQQTPLNARSVIDDWRVSVGVSSGNKINLCAFSLAGMIALKWAELFPEDLRSVVVINSSLRQLSPFYDRLSPTAYLRICAALMSSNPEDQEAGILKLTSNCKVIPQSRIEAYAKFSRENPFQIANFFRQLALANSIHLGANLSPPLRVVVSKNDRLVSSRCSFEIAKYFSVEPIIHESAGHDISFDDPAWLARVLTLV